MASVRKTQHFSPSSPRIMSTKTSEKNSSAVKASATPALKRSPALSLSAKDRIALAAKAQVAIQAERAKEASKKAVVEEKPMEVTLTYEELSQDTKNLVNGLTDADLKALEESYGQAQPSFHEEEDSDNDTHSNASTASTNTSTAKDASKITIAKASAAAGEGRVRKPKKKASGNCFTGSVAQYLYVSTPIGANVKVKPSSSILTHINGLMLENLRSKDLETARRVRLATATVGDVYAQTVNAVKIYQLNAQGEAQNTVFIPATEWDAAGEALVALRYDPTAWETVAVMDTSSK